MKNYRSQMVCAHSIVAWSLLVGFGLFVIPDWMPPISPDQSIGEIALYFQNTGVSRVGFALGAFAAPFFILFFTVMRNQMRRIEGHNGIWGDINLFAAAIGSLAVQFPAFFWLAISYRPELSADVVAVLNDIAWFMLLGATGAAVMQNIAIACCILLVDPNQTVFPRWLGYWNLWLAFTLMPGVLLPFFKTGPFAYDGIFGFWLVAVSFFVWVFLNYFYTVKAIKQERDPGNL